MTLEEFPLFNLLEESEKDWYKFLVWLVAFFSEAIWSQTVVCSEFLFFFFFFTDSISLLVYYVFLLDSVLVGCTFLETCPFLSIVQSILLWFFVFLQYQLLLLFHFLLCLGPLFCLVSLARSLLILFTLSQNQFLVLFIFSYFFFLISIYYFFPSADFRFCLFFS